MSGVTASSAPAAAAAAATADTGGLTDNNILSPSAMGAIEAQVDAAITASVSSIASFSGVSVEC
jgi:hypothetical protein